MSRAGIYVFIAALLAAFTPPCASSAYGGDWVQVPEVSYEIDRAEYLYRTGDSLDASVLLNRLLRANRDFPERTRAIVLKWLSDLTLRYRASDPGAGLHGAALDSNPALVDIMEILNYEGDYDSLAALAKGIEGPDSGYWRGLGLFGAGRLDEAEKDLARVQPDEPLYPFSKIMLAEINALKGALYDSEAHLDELEENRSPILNNELGYMADLKLAYLLHEKGEYPRAKKRFLKIPPESRSYPSARQGIAWTLIKTGEYREALDIIETLGVLAPPSPPLQVDPARQELLAAAALCMYKIGRTEEAKGLLLRVITVLSALEDELESIANGNGRPEAKSEGETTTLIDRRKLMTLLKNSPDARAASGYGRAFWRIKGFYEKREQDVASLLTTLEDKISILETELSDAKRRMRIVRRLLTVLGKKSYVTLDGVPVMIKGDESLPATEGIIVNRWEKTLNRRLTDLEKVIVHIVALDGVESIRYLNNTVYFEPLFWMAIDQSKDRPDGYGKGILEKIVIDLDEIVRGGGTLYEKIVPQLEVTVLEKIEEDRQLAERVADLKDRLASEKTRAAGALEDARRLRREAVARRAGMMKYEVRLVTTKALAALEKMDDGEKGGGE